MSRISEYELSENIYFSELSRRIDMFGWMYHPHASLNGFITDALFILGDIEKNSSIYNKKGHEEWIWNLNLLVVKFLRQLLNIRYERNPENKEIVPNEMETDFIDRLHNVLNVISNDLIYKSKAKFINNKKSELWKAYF